MISLLPTILLFSLETYHAFSHAVILFGIRLLPRKDLVRVRFYFLIDTGTVLLTTVLFAPQLWWLCLLQMIQHLFYFVTWDQSSSCKKVITWSSLDYEGLKQSRFALAVWDLVAGTAFDLAVHLVMLRFIAAELSYGHILVGLALCFTAAKLVIFNPKFAWSSPNSIPNWVSKRIAQISSIHGA